MDDLLLGLRTLIQTNYLGKYLLVENLDYVYVNGSQLNHGCAHGCAEAHIDRNI